MRSGAGAATPSKRSRSDRVRARRLAGGLACVAGAAGAAGLVLAAAGLSGCASRRASAPASPSSPPAVSSRSSRASRPGAGAEPARGWTEEGIASWYGGNDGFEGKPTASGEIYDSEKLTAAHRTLPLGTVLEVMNVENSRTVRVRINDRGPFVRGRVIDLSRAAARELRILGPGTGSVRISLVSRGAEPEPDAEAASSDTAWAVQVGSFGEPERAQRHAERVRATGRPVYLEPYRGLSRVKVGPYPSRETAQDALSKLEAAGFEGIVTAAEGRR